MSNLTAASELARTLGEPASELVICAEGNVSAREDVETFWVKASGFTMREIGPEGFVRVQFEPILEALGKSQMSDPEVKEVLTLARLEQAGPMPSVETFMHAYLLCLPGVEVVGHTHPTSLLSLLALESAEEFASLRIFPDEVVCCGPAACFVPYLDPGVGLAQGIKRSVEAFAEKHGSLPKTIWLANHGLIALGGTPAEVLSATLMSSKSAKIWLASLGTGEKIRNLTPGEISRIHTRPDEHYRQRLLWEMRANPLQ